MRMLIRREIAAGLLAAFLILPSAWQGDVAVHAASQPVSKKLVLPTYAQVLKAVSEAATSTKLPPLQPPYQDQGWGGHCIAQYLETTSALCVSGDPQGSHTLVVYGDSHGYMWMPAFTSIGTYLHWRIIQIQKAGCQVADFPRWLPAYRRPYTECAAFQSFAIASIKKLHPDMVVVTSLAKDAELVVHGQPTTTGLESAWATGLATMLARLKPLAGRVIVLGDMPYPNQVSDDCLSAHASDIRACDTPRADAVLAAHNRMEQRVATQHGVRYVDTTAWFCTATVCPAVINGIEVYADLYHITLNYALWLSDVMGTATGILAQ